MKRTKFTIADLESKETELLTPQEVADVLGCSRKTFMRSVRNDEFNGLFKIVKMGQRFRIPKKEFLDFASKIKRE